MTLKAVTKSHTVAEVATAVLGTAAAINGFQLSVTQFKLPNRVLGETEEFLFAQALAILFIFPCTYDVELHFSSPFSAERIVPNQLVTSR
jgi:hypothetical protein